jgi:hydrogenase maturation protein HypF
MAESIHVRGLVQGVGFRPFVWHLAQRLGIRGRVWNDGDGVRIQAWGDAGALRHFCRQLCDAPPPMARIDALESVSLEETDMPDAFVIVDSRPGPCWPAIAPDAAICPDCLRSAPVDPQGHAL